VNRVVINFVPGAVGYPDAIRAKAGAKSSLAGGLIVPDIKHEIVFHGVIASATQIDSNSGKGRGIIVSSAAHLVFLDYIGAGVRADAPNADGTICGRGAGAEGNPTFHVDDVAPDRADQRVRSAGALRGNAARIDLVHSARNRVADEVVFD
jgi:hypothetical protein